MPTASVVPFSAAKIKPSATAVPPFTVPKLLATSPAKVAAPAVLEPPANVPSNVQFSIVPWFSIAMPAVTVLSPNASNTESTTVRLLTTPPSPMLSISADLAPLPSLNSKMLLNTYSPPSSVPVKSSIPPSAPRHASIASPPPKSMLEVSL